MDIQASGPGGGSSSAAQFIYKLVLTASSISPLVGPLAGGTSVTINGSLFGTDTQVFIGGAAATNVVVAGDGNSLTAVTPARTQHGQATVTVKSGGNTASVQSGFTYVPAPTIGSISPATGPTAGNFSVQIRGTNFVPGATPTVTFGSDNAVSPVVQDSTTIFATAPLHAAGTVVLSVTTGSQTVTTSFEYKQAPAIAVLNPSPAEGPIAGGTAVVIFGDGTSFTNGVTTATVGGTPAVVVVSNPVELQLTTPAHAAGLVEIIVTTGAESVTITNGFRYIDSLAAPTISAGGVSPAGVGSTGGATLTITGNNLTDVSSVEIGSFSIPAADVTVLSNSSLTAKAPSLLFPGLQSVTVRNSHGQFATLNDGLNVVSAGPFCDAGVTSDCISSFSVTNANGTPATNPPNIVPSLSSFGGSMTLQVVNALNSGDAQYELTPTLKTAATDSSTIVAIIKTSDSFTPKVALTTSRLVSWGFNGTTRQATVTVEPRRSSWNRAQGCAPPPGTCALQADIDYNAFVLVSLADFTGAPADPEFQAFATALNGAALFTNGQYFSTPDRDPVTGALTFSIGSPHFAVDGVTVNTDGFFGFFVPDTFITNIWGVPDPNTLAQNASASTVTIGGQPVTPTVTDVPATATNPAGIKWEFEDIGFSVKEVEIAVTAVATPVAASTGGQPVNVDVPSSVGTVDITLSNVTTGGTVAVSVSASVSGTAPTGFTFIQKSMEVTPTGVVFASADVCFPYTDEEVTNAGLTESNLRLLHFESSVWRDVTKSLDTTNNQICGTVTSFSPFALASTTTANAAPVVTTLTVASKPEGAEGFTLSVPGSNFVSGSVVQWKGANRTTTFISSSELRIDVTTADLAVPGSATVAVVTPAPGGGTASRTFSVNPAYYLGEGATGSFFDTFVHIANPNTTDAAVSLTHFNPDGTTKSQTLTVPSNSRRTLRVDDLPGEEATAVSTRVESTGGLTLVVEESMTWGADGLGGHGSSANEGTATRWLFAEGAQGFFDGYLLLGNANSASATATVTFLLESAAAVTKSYTVDANSRLTIAFSTIAELAGRSFGIIVDATRPIFAQRAMYFGADFAGGHMSSGVTAASTSWSFSEGATGAFFDTFLLLANPNTATATVTVRYLLPSGSPVTRTYTVAGQRRLTVFVDAEDTQLADTAVAMQITADQPIVAERSMYWGGPYPGWIEAHASPGLTASATRWAVADGIIGGSPAFETYLLVSNTGSSTASLRVTYRSESGTEIVRTWSVAANSRLNIHANSDAATLPDGRFWVLVESTNSVPVFVERSLYWNAGGRTWGGGLNAPATRLP